MDFWHACVLQHLFVILVLSCWIRVQTKDTVVVPPELCLSPLIQSSRTISSIFLQSSQLLVCAVTQLVCFPASLMSYTATLFASLAVLNLTHVSNRYCSHIFQMKRGVFCDSDNNHQTVTHNCHRRQYQSAAVVSRDWVNISAFYFHICLSITIIRHTKMFLDRKSVV